MVTSCYSNERIGVRHLSNGLKVYHLPLSNMARQCSFIDLFVQFIPILRQIWIREQIEIVHSHQAASILQMAGLITAQVMGMRNVFTDHSLFGFGDAASINLNKTIKWVMT